MSILPHYKWHRAEKDTGLRAVCYNNSKRPWQLFLGSVLVASIKNGGAIYDVMTQTNGKDEWVVRVYLSDPFRSFTLKKLFSTEELPRAKVLARKLYEKKVAEENRSKGVL